MVNQIARPGTEGATSGNWWENPGAGTAPAGYKYDPVQQRYVRTPSSVGSDAGAAFQGLEAGLGPYADPTTAQSMAGFGGDTGGSGSAASSARAQQSPGQDAYGSGYVFGGGGQPSAQPSNPDTSSAGNWDANNARNQAAQRGLASSVVATPAAVTPAATPAAVAPMAAPAAAPALQQVNQQPANAAAFAQAKDSIGLQMRGALTGLAGAMAGRGISGSGLEAAGDVGVVNTGQGQLGGVSRDQAVTNANLSNANAVTAYQGGLTQRAQDIGVGEANLGAATTGRGQDIGVNEANLVAASTGRGQDIGIGEANQNSFNTQRAQDLQMQEEALNNATTQRGQTIGANTALSEANTAANTARRGQSIGASTALSEAGTSQATAERGQDVGYAESQNSLRQAAMLARQQRMADMMRGLSY
jgi:hypothetical protein